MVHCTVLPAGTQGGEALRVMRVVWHRRTCIRNLQSLHRRWPIWEPATHSHNGERNESAGRSHFAGNCKKPQPMGNWLRGNWKHSENSRKKLKIPLKNCKTGRQGRENAHQAAQQKSPTDLKWLDISIKRTWKIGHRLRWFCAMQQRKKPVTFFMSQAFGAPEGIRTPGTWRRRTKTGRYRLTLKREFCWLYTVTTQNKKKPIVGCHNRLFRHFEGRLHSSGQMVVNNPTHSHIFSAKKVLWLKWVAKVIIHLLV